MNPRRFASPQRHLGGYSFITRISSWSAIRGITGSRPLILPCNTSACRSRFAQTIKSWAVSVDFPRCVGPSFVTCWPELYSWPNSSTNSCRGTTSTEPYSAVLSLGALVSATIQIYPTDRLDSCLAHRGDYLWIIEHVCGELVRLIRHVFDSRNVELPAEF